MSKRKGQSTLEYVIILTAIIAAIVFAAVTFLKPRVQSSLDNVTSQMQVGVQQLDLSNITGGD
jgi:Flp pilus assembly pilin Flp